jgi:hypothetical protein
MIIVWKLDRQLGRPRSYTRKRQEPWYRTSADLCSDRRRSESSTKRRFLQGNAVEPVSRSERSKAERWEIEPGRRCQQKGLAQLRLRRLRAIYPPRIASAIPITVMIPTVVPVMVVAAVVVPVPPAPGLCFRRNEGAPEQERYERGDDDPHGNPDSRDSKLTQSTVARINKSLISVRVSNCTPARTPRSK